MMLYLIMLFSYPTTNFFKEENVLLKDNIPYEKHAETDRLLMSTLNELFEDNPTESSKVIMENGFANSAIIKDLVSDNILLSMDIKIDKDEDNYTLNYGYSPGEFKFVYDRQISSKVIDKYFKVRGFIDVGVFTYPNRKTVKSYAVRKHNWKNIKNSFELSYTLMYIQ